MRSDTRELLDKKRAAFKDLQCSIDDFANSKCGTVNEVKGIRRDNTLTEQVSRQMEPVRSFMDTVQHLPLIGFIIKHMMQ